jgi:hypothetical protein
VSSDHGPGAPSFGDLFEDPDSPLAPAAPVASPDIVVAAPSAGAPEPAVTVSDAAERVAHDLDHESAEASHLVAGFESADDDGIVVVPPAHDAPVEVAPVVAAAAAAGVSVPASPWDGTVDRSVSSAPAGRVDTGRLYRSAGAEGPATLDAIPAIDPSWPPARRTEVADDEKPAPVRSAQRGLTYSGVVVIVVGVTVLVAIAEALLREEVGVLTGIALLASSVYCALVVRRADIWAAVVIPPLAFLVALLTAGQLTIRGKTGGLLVREGALLFVSLATNAPWILGTTLVCLVIVLVRRRRAQSA